MRFSGKLLLEEGFCDKDNSARKSSDLVSGAFNESRDKVSNLTFVWGGMGKKWNIMVVARNRDQSRVRRVRVHCDE